MADHALIKKYDVPGPRYTSYQTVPYWNTDDFSVARWEETVERVFRECNDSDGISVYIHLPFCESLCTFCGCTKRITRNHDVESPYIDNLLAEWSARLADFPGRPRVSEIHLGGGTPTFFAPDNLKRLIEGLLAETDKAEPTEFGFEAHPNSTTEAHLRTLRELGFSRLSLGVQEFNPQVQSMINRIQPYERVREVTLAARDLGYASVNFDLVYGLPAQTPACVEDTISKVETLMPDRIAFYSYAHVPWIRGIGQRKFSESDLPRGAEKRRLYEMGRERLEHAGYREVGMDHFALEHDSLYGAMLNGRLHRNFMGYTNATSRLMVGLGMSSISDSWYGFAQNEKKVEDYSAAISEGRTPVFRGHILDDEDLLLRRHILNLMCRFETTWGEEDLAVPAFSEGLSRLDEMAADGLVEFESNALRILPAGRAFIRNVCMVLDARLWRHQPDSRIFSQVI